ncbi:DUF2953 domain-containing protein [Neobacillus mesonae]|nr:DUF2953 domain-containing protein [Neobacillus mesonae]
MWIWIGAGVLLVILLIIVLVLISNIHIHLVVKSKDNKQEVFVQFKMLYGLLRMKKELPEEKIEAIKAKLLMNLQRAISEEGEDKEGSREEQSETKHGKKGITHQVRALMKSAYALKIWDTPPFSSIRILQLRWHTLIGTEDVVITSMTTGLLWGVKSTMLGWLSHKVRFIEMPDLEVTPNWKEKWDLDTSIELRACIKFFRGMRLSNMITKRLAEAHGGILSWRRDLEEEA